MSYSVKKISDHYKEKYYDDGIIDSVAQNFLDDVRIFRKKRNWRLSNKSAALLVLDMQKFFIDEKSHAYVPSATAIITRIK
ncbi:MAG: hypothetical protein DRN20_05495, partial [Thermoplasmata archaeon]